MGIAIFVPGVSFANNNLGKVTLVESDKPIESLEIVGKSIVNDTSNTTTYTVNYTPSNTSQKGVVWSVEEGSEYADIDVDGNLTIKASGNVKIKATSKVNNSVFSTKDVVVTFVEDPSVLAKGSFSANNGNASKKVDISNFENGTYQVIYKKEGTVLPTGAINIYLTSDVSSNDTSKRVSGYSPVTFEKTEGINCVWMFWGGQYTMTVTYEIKKV